MTNGNQPASGPRRTWPVQNVVGRGAGAPVPCAVELGSGAESTEVTLLLGREVGVLKGDAVATLASALRQADAEARRPGR